MTPRIYGAALNAEHFVVKNATGIYDAARGRSTAPDIKRDTKLDAFGSVVYRTGRGGQEWSGNQSNAYFMSAYTPKVNGGLGAVGCVASRVGTKGSSSGFEVLASISDATNVAGGIKLIIGIDDGTYTGTAGLLACRARYQNGGTDYLVTGPAVKTDGTPMALAAAIRKNSVNSTCVDFFVDGVHLSHESATTSTTDEFGRFAVGALYVSSSASEYISSASSVLMAWHGITPNPRQRQLGYREWTEDPWGIYARPSRRYFWPSSGDGGTPIDASLTASLAVATSITASVSSKKATLTLKNAAGIAVSNKANLKWAWWDYITPDLIAASPTDKGALLSTDGSGVCEIPLVNSVKTSGQVGWVIITDSNGDPDQAPGHSAFSGPVAVD